MINPGDREARALGIRIAEERPDAGRIGLWIAELVEEHRKAADTAAVRRMSAPLGDADGRLVRAEHLAARVRMLDSPEGLLAMELKWTCEELRRRISKPDRRLFDKFAALAANLVPGRTMILKDGFVSGVLKEPGCSNGLPGWWFTDGGFMSFANMMACDARVEPAPAEAATP